MDAGCQMEQLSANAKTRIERQGKNNRDDLFFPNAQPLYVIKYPSNFSLFHSAALTSALKLKWHQSIRLQNYKSPNTLSSLVQWPSKLFVTVLRDSQRLSPGMVCFVLCKPPPVKTTVFKDPGSSHKTIIDLKQALNRAGAEFSERLGVTGVIAESSLFSQTQHILEKTVRNRYSKLSHYSFKIEMEIRLNL